MCCFWAWAFCPLSVSPRMRRFVRGFDAMIDLILGGVVAIGLMIYLLVALLRPETF